MKFKKIVMSIMGIGLSLNLVGVSPAYATDNPLKDSQEKEQENLKIFLIRLTKINPLA